MAPPGGGKPDAVAGQGSAENRQDVLRMRCVSLSAVVCTLCLAVAALVSLSSGRQATAAPEPGAAPMDDYKKPLLLNPRIQTEVLLSTSGNRQHRIIVSAPQDPV